MLVKNPSQQLASMGHIHIRVCQLMLPNADKDVLILTLHRYAREAGGHLPFDPDVLGRVLSEWEIGSIEQLANLEEPARRGIGERVHQCLGGAEMPREVVPAWPWQAHPD